MVPAGEDAFGYAGFFVSSQPSVFSSQSKKEPG